MTRGCSHQKQSLTASPYIACFSHIIVFIRNGEWHRFLNCERAGISYLLCNTALRKHYKNFVHMNIVYKNFQGN